MQSKRTVVFLVILSGLFGACRSRESEIDIDLPPEIASMAVIDRHPLLDYLRSQVSQNSSYDVVYRLIVHPSMGQTFFVNIDSDRDVIKLHPARERYETIIFYDPHNQASMTAETGSNYIQSRCSKCNSNRFELAGAFFFKPGNRTGCERFILGGKCAECGQETVLFE